MLRRLQHYTLVVPVPTAGSRQYRTHKHQTGQIDTHTVLSALYPCCYCHICACVLKVASNTRQQPAACRAAGLDSDNTHYVGQRLGSTHNKFTDMSM